MHIQSIPMWSGSSNNYAYLITDSSTKDSILIDPANPPEVLPTIQTQISSNTINLTAILNTHHHWDHAGGNDEMLTHFPSLPLIGGKDCKRVTRTPGHEEKFPVGKGITVTALHTPCHTMDSICYYLEDNQESSTTSSSSGGGGGGGGVKRAVFTGDTLFIGGCGKFFEGTPQQMHVALNQTLASLPDDTLVYPGHEYTKSNVKFLSHVDPDNEAVGKLAEFAERNKVTTGVFTIADEKRHNVFMRVGEEAMRKVTGQSGESEVLGRLREMKNNM